MITGITIQPLLGHEVRRVVRLFIQMALSKVYSQKLRSPENGWGYPMLMDPLLFCYCFCILVILHLCLAGGGAEDGEVAPGAGGEEEKAIPPAAYMSLALHRCRGTPPLSRGSRSESFISWGVYRRQPRNSTIVVATFVVISPIGVIVVDPADPLWV